LILVEVVKKLNDFDMDIKLTIKEGSIVALTGESGSGKSTLLRIIAGLEDAKGVIKVGKTFWLNETKKTPPQKRDIGFVFQNYALFDNMSVEKNLLYIKNDKALAKKLLEMVELTKQKDRLPHQLSGGQKQRVALARAFMRRPSIALLDEPLSALDQKMREKLQNDIVKMHKEFDTTIIFVSHDPSEIYKISDEVIVLKEGRVDKKGLPKEILLKTSGSQKLSFEGEILDLKKVDVIYVAIISIGQQIVEVVISEEKAKQIKIGQKVTISTKAFSPVVGLN